MCIFLIAHYQATSNNETAFEQQASLEVKSFFGFEHVVERIAVKHYSANIKKGEEIIEYHIKQLSDEGVHYIEPFEPVDTVCTVAVEEIVNGHEHSNGAANNNNNTSTSPVLN